MTWVDVENIIFDGSRQEIETLTCPECGNSIYINYEPQIKHLEYGCKKCRICAYLSGCEIPAFADTNRDTY